MTLENLREILAIEDPDEFASELGVTINGSRWGKVADSVGLGYVRTLLAQCAGQMAAQDEEIEKVRLSLRDAVEARDRWHCKVAALDAEIVRLRKALERAGEAIHSEYCTEKHHRECAAVDAALSGGAHE